MTRARRRLGPALARAALGFVALGALSLAAPAAAQRTGQLGLAGPRGVPADPIPVGWQRGYAAVPLAALERIGWTIVRADSVGEARRGDVTLLVRERSPFLRWGATPLQMANEPYRYGSDLWVPLQLLTDFLPQRSPREYLFRSNGPTLEVAEAAWTPDAPARRAALAEPVPTRADPAPTRAPVVRPSAPATTSRASGRSPPPPSRGGTPAAAHPAAADPAVRVVVIDPGHGGTDPGARGPRGAREKDIALRVGLALQRELEKRPDLEVHLTRAQDRLVPLWERGEWATGIKDGRHAVFLSLHANAETSLSARGFETYFLSEARTEHEKRVAALENAPFQMGGPAGERYADPLLSDILADLSNVDTQRWSAELADLVQRELAEVHPGPNRGVKQAPLAVITNSLMPSVLIELGFISNADEERLLGTVAFQERAAGAIARAVDEFFEHYPPQGPGGQR